MFGLLPPAHKKEPKWEETRTRINDHCIKVNRVNHNAPSIIDPKGDFELIDVVVFYSTGQLPFGEWLKKLGKNDTAPRGACCNYFAKNVRYRR